MTALRTPYLMFIGDSHDQLAAKVADGVVFWRRDWCVGQFRLPGCKADLKIPDMSIEDAAKAGVGTVIVGVANRGGKIPDSWVESPVKALDLGMDVASGLHKRPADIPELAEAAKRNGRILLDVRHPTQTFDVADGKKRSGKRLLAVGTDCSIGKMFTALAIEKEMRGRGKKADFRATGQTGIFIAGSGIAVDAIVSDFISGSVEWLCPANDDDHWDIIEGRARCSTPPMPGSASACCTARPPMRWSCATSRPASTCAACRPIRCRASRTASASTRRWAA